MDFRAAFLVSRRVYKMNNSKLAFELSAKGKFFAYIRLQPNQPHNKEISTTVDSRVMGSLQTTKGPFLIDPETQIHLVSLRMKELDVPTSQGYLQSVFYRHNLGYLLEVLVGLYHGNK